MSAPDYYELSVEVHAKDVHALSDALLELGALSVTIEDANAGTAFESPLFDEPNEESDELHSGEPRTAWRRSLIHALIAPKYEPLFILAAAARRSGWTGLPPYRIRSVEDQDWLRQMQAQFGPLSVGEKIWVIPSWHEALADVPKNAYRLRLDPGLAFGTGSHPTTRLCMAWLEQMVKPEHTVLDYGCGSGILAILAKQCGAAHVTGVDLDPRALEVARHNSARNRTDIEYILPDHCPERRFDIVVANIYSNPLIRLARMLCAHLQRNGRLALAGILERQAQELIQAYAPWIQLSVWRTEEGWVCLTGQAGID